MTKIGRQNILWFSIGFLTIALSLVACGPEFQGQTQYRPSYLDAEDFVELAKEVDWKTGDTLSFSIGVDGNPDVSQEMYAATFSLKIPFATSYGFLASAINKFSPRVCQKVDIYNSPTEEYRKGEIPCGEIINSEWKKLYKFDIPKTRTESAGFDIKVDDFSLNLYMSRNQRSGTYLESDLSEKATIEKQSHSEFLKDISIRYIPNGTSTDLQLCFNLPGVRFRTDNKKVKTTAKRKVIFGKRSLKDKIKAKFGEIDFSNMRSCGSFRVSMNAENFQPNLEILEIQKPVFNNLVVEKTKVRFTSWWAEALNGLIDVFTINVEKTVSRSVDQSIRETVYGEVESGRWLGLLLGDDFNHKIREQIAQRLTRETYQNQNLLDYKKLRKKINRQCSKLSTFIPESSELYDFYLNCEAIIDQIYLEANPFYFDPDLQQKGCYDHFANIFTTEEESSWWAKECQMTLRIEARVPKSLESYVPAFMELINSFRGIEDWPDVARQTLADIELEYREVEKLVEDFKQQFQRVPSQDELFEILEDVSSEI